MKQMPIIDIAIGIAYDQFEEEKKNQFKEENTFKGETKNITTKANTQPTTKTTKKKMPCTFIKIRNECVGIGKKEK